MQDADANAPRVLPATNNPARTLPGTFAMRALGPAAVATCTAFAAIPLAILTADWYASDSMRDWWRPDTMGPIARASPIRPIPPQPPMDEHRVALGSRLFHDPRLSQDGTVSCATCHDVQQGGDDNQALSRGVGGQLGRRNAPTVLNAALNFRQFWDGRAATLEAQVDGPLTHPHEMASSWEEILATLEADASYVHQFTDSFGGGPTPDRVRTALADYQRSLVTPQARLDRWIRGELDALTPYEQEGYYLFIAYGCDSCHNGVNAGGNSFQRLGVMADYFAKHGSSAVGGSPDLGRFELTGDERDRHVFKVPSLRNVEHTAPYFHDGSAATLEEAVAVMIEYQLGRTVVSDEVAKLTALLRTLSGKIPNGEP
jgi:cytochrome c peroxidase